MSADQGNPKSAPPPAIPPEEARRGLIERIVKKGIETGMDALEVGQDTIKGFVDKHKLPKEVASMLFEQMDETKNGLYRAVSKEIRDFLASTNFAAEMKKILTGLAFEVKMEVRFKSTEDEDGKATGSIRPSVDADVSVKDRRKKDRDKE